MNNSSRGTRVLFLPLVLLLMALTPATAPAATHSFLDLQGYRPSESGGLGGPATTYPGTIAVSGLPGTVTKATVTSFELSMNGDLDMALVGPNGQQVMLLSDACRSVSGDRVFWTFDDAAPTFVSPLSCPPTQTASVRPTNHEGPEDTFTSGGPAGPFGNSLAAFNGISPNGAWNLFVIDDDPTEMVGFEMAGWALTLEVQPPPPPPPTVITVPVPVPVPAQSPTSVAQTGKRAAAMKRCAQKKTKEQRQACRAKAKKLPL